MIKTKNFIITLLSSLVFLLLFNIDKFKDGDIIKYNKVYNFFMLKKKLESPILLLIIPLIFGVTKAIQIETITQNI